MKIYQAKQESWNNGRMTDFDLPRHIGYYLTWDKAESEIQSDMSQHEMSMNADTFVTRDDYKITSFDVEE